MTRRLLAAEVLVASAAELVQLALVTHSILPKRIHRPQLTCLVGAWALLACSPAATAPASTATTVAVDPPTVASDASPEPADEPSPPRAELPTASALARRLIVEQDVALYDGVGDAIVYADSWTQEGTGLGLRVQRHAASTTTTLFEQDPGESTEQELEAAVAGLEAALAGPSWQVLSKTPWEDAATPLTIPTARLTATFEPPTLSLRSHIGAATISVGPPSATPHLPRPIAIYAREGVPVVVVAIWFDAGAGYARGYNHYSEHRVLRLR